MATALVDVIAELPSVTQSTHRIVRDDNKIVVIKHYEVWGWFITQQWITKVGGIFYVSSFAYIYIDVPDPLPTDLCRM